MTSKWYYREKQIFTSILKMVSDHANNNSNMDAYINVMQGKALFPGNQLPRIVWNQIKILIVSNKDGK